ncbi:hypothetical protein [Terasakiella sp. SH-1]|uniref:hypothetical protein n=1 Tax=Terasakiella sp. SH-1 TaxID=2560057 RepID=UPI001073B97A|nr:hypothetical protein [Terasakiella sp. SH-1]
MQSFTEYRASRTGNSPAASKRQNLRAEAHRLHRQGSDLNKKFSRVKSIEDKIDLMGEILIVQMQLSMLTLEASLRTPQSSLDQK